MIYFIYGDSNRVFVKANSLLDSFVKKNSNTNVLKIDSDNWSNFNFNELIGGQSLFTQKQIIYFKKLFSNKETVDLLINKLDDISKSENIFIVVEEKLDKKLFNQVEKKAEKTQIFEKAEAKKINSNLFSLTDLFGKRDAKKLWLAYQEKVQKFRPEEIHGILWWQIKTMLLVRKSKDLKDSGLKPFVFSKAQSFNKNYSDLELNNLADQFVYLLHDSRRGKLDLDLAIEKFILSL